MQVFWKGWGREFKEGEKEKQLSSMKHYSAKVKVKKKTNIVIVTRVFTPGEQVYFLFLS